MTDKIKSPTETDQTVLGHNTSEKTEGSGEQADNKIEKLQIGSVIKERFILVNELGRGGMGVVYKARDLRKVEARDRNPYIALKVLSDDFKYNPDSFIALQRETRKSQDLAHPNIVTVYDFDKDGPHVYMTMECLNGKPLSELLHNQELKGKLLKDRWDIIKQIGLALAYAHEKNIIHLDLKPGNIYIKNDGIVKVLDFGIARAVKSADQTQTSGDTTVFDAGSLGALTPSYASCEMLENQDPDFRDDIYAFACVAFEVLTGKHPFNKIPATQARFNKSVVAPIPEISKKQRKALSHALAFNRDERTPTVFQFLRDAQLISPKNTLSTGEYWKWPIVLVGAVVLAITLFLAYFKQGAVDNQEPGSSKSNRAVVSKPLTEKQKQKIIRILEVAEMHALIGRYTEPRGTNALDAYNQVLLIDPSNETAKQGLLDIANFYEQEAKTYWEEGNKESSLEMMKKGLLVLPNDKDLLQFKKKFASEPD